jgi:hypothetical protein
VYNDILDEEFLHAGIEFIMTLNIRRRVDIKPLKRPLLLKTRTALIILAGMLGTS